MSLLGGWEKFSGAVKYCICFMHKRGRRIATCIIPNGHPPRLRSQPLPL